MGNLYSRIFRKREVRILIQGLDAAGKTTMLYRLKLGEVVTTIPTIGFNVETIEHKNVSLTAWDVGGRDKIRPLYRHYYANTNGIVFVIDSNDKDDWRIDQIRDEIVRALDEDELQSACVAVIANKQDIPGAMSTTEIVDKLNLNRIKQRWCIFPASAITGEGLYESLDWLVEQMSRNQAEETRSKVTEDAKKSASAMTKYIEGLDNFGEKLKTVFASWFSSSKG